MINQRCGVGLIQYYPVPGQFKAAGLPPQGHAARLTSRAAYWFMQTRRRRAAGAEL